MHFLDDPFPDIGRPIRHVSETALKMESFDWPLQGWHPCLGSSLEKWPWQAASPKGSSWRLRSVSSFALQSFHGTAENVHRILPNVV